MGGNKQLTVNENGRMKHEGYTMFIGYFQSL